MSHIVSNPTIENVCHIAGRDPKLPVIYEAINHPLTRCPNGRSFYVKQDLHEVRMREALDLERELKIPLGKADDVSDLGKTSSIHLNLC
jgi:hypothetical protein